MAYIKDNPHDNKPRNAKVSAPAGSEAAYPKVMYAKDSADHKKVWNEAEQEKAAAAGYFLTPAPGTFGVPEAGPEAPSAKTDEPAAPTPGKPLPLKTK